MNRAEKETKEKQVEHYFGTRAKLLYKKLHTKRLIEKF